MSDISKGITLGLLTGLRDSTNILASGLTSYTMARSGISPNSTLYVNLDSPSGFSSWAHPSYATPMNVALSSAGFDTTYAPLTSAISSSFSSGTSFLAGSLLTRSILGGSLLGGGLFGFGYTDFGFHHHCHHGFHHWC